MESFKPNSSSYDYLFKIVILGDSKVGKSNLIDRFVNDSFFDGNITTFGVDFKIRTVVFDNKVIKIQIWDSLGMNRSKNVWYSLPPMKTMGIVLMYDIINDLSFKNIKEWINDIERHSEGKNYKILIGHKMDLSSQRVISVETGQFLAKEFGYNFIEASAKTGENIEKIFEILIKEMMESNIIKSEHCEKKVNEIKKLNNKEKEFHVKSLCTCF